MRQVPEARRAKVDFNRDVRPLLAQHCWPCYGQDKASLARTGGLSLDSFAGATALHNGIHALVPGSPAKSEAMVSIGAKDEALRMPPVNSGIKPLSGAEVETIRLWIAQGAEYRSPPATCA